MQTSARYALIVTTAAGFWMRQRNGRKISLSNSQHWILHVLCAPQQRSRKGRGDHPKMVFSIFFTFSFEHFRFAIFGKTKTIAQNRGRIHVKAGHARVFMFLLPNNLTFRCLLFLKGGNVLVVYGAQTRRPYFHEEMKAKYYVATI